jgi:hypothetical protein
VVVSELVPGRSSCHTDFYLGARVRRKKKARGGREEAVRSKVEPAAGLSLFSCAIREALVPDATKKRSVWHPKRLNMLRCRLISGASQTGPECNGRHGSDHQLFNWKSACK